MSRVRFLFNAPERLGTAADWLARRDADAARVWVLCPPDGSAPQIDQLLWTRSALGFVPHCGAQSPLVAETPIVIGEVMPDADDFTTLLNLTVGVPDGYERFAEVIEVVSTDEADRLAARERVNQYRLRGHKPEMLDAACAFAP